MKGNHIDDSLLKHTSWQLRLAGLFFWLVIFWAGIFKGIENPIRLSLLTMSFLFPQVLTREGKDKITAWQQNGNEEEKTSLSGILD